jgi:hypothetical protein
MGNRQAKIPGLGMPRLIFILAVLCGLSGAARGQNASLQMRLEKALENARSITNVEIQYDDMLWIKGGAGPFTDEFTRTMHVTYISAEGKYRTECRNVASTTNAIKLHETAFDGKLYSGFTADTGYMTQQDGNPPGDTFNPLSPLIEPFLFLSSDSDDCPACHLRFTELRSPDRLNGLILPEAESSNGALHLSFPGLPRNGVNQLCNITIDDADPDFTPRTISNISYASRDDICFETIYTLSDYTILGAYHFPTKIAYSIFETPTNNLLAPTLAGTSMGTVVSVKIPTQIHDSTFRLDESEALHVWNHGETKGYGVLAWNGDAAAKSALIKKEQLKTPPTRSGHAKETGRDPSWHFYN